MKRYVREPGAASVRRLLKTDPAAASRLSEVEVASALVRLARLHLHVRNQPMPTFVGRRRAERLPPGGVGGPPASRPYGLHQSAYFEPSSAVASDPLLTSNTPALALGLLGSGSAGTASHDLEDFVNGSSGILRR